MKVLGIDTSGYVNAVGIVENKRALAEMSFPAETDSLEQIVDNIDATLQHAGLTLGDIDGYGVGIGPGSWTGIRVGVTVGKTLAYATGKPVSGVSSLDAIAHVGRDRERPLVTVVAVGAGNAVYAAKYRQVDSTVVRDGDYFTGSLQELATLITEPVILLGKGARDYTKEIKQYVAADIIPIEARVYGSSAASVAEERLNAGQIDDTLGLTPLYLKESTAKAFVNKYAGKEQSGGGT